MCWSSSRWCTNVIVKARNDHGGSGSFSICSWRSTRVNEGLRRIFDVSKQVIGQMFVHGVNVLISDVVAHVSSGNACVLYFLNILLDTTFGTSRLPLDLSAPLTFSAQALESSISFCMSRPISLPSSAI